VSKFKVGDIIKRNFPDTLYHGKVGVVVRVEKSSLHSSGSIDYLVYIHEKSIEVWWNSGYICGVSKLEKVMK
jgi:ribosomal protein L21E